MLAHDIPLDGNRIFALCRARFIPLWKRNVELELKKNIEGVRFQTSWVG